MTDTDILAFLKARIAEDERRARAAGWHSWSVNDGRVLAGNGKVVAEPGRDYDAAHIALHDPSRVLREVAAKRILLEEHGHYISSGYNGVEAFDVIRCIVCHDDDEDAGVVYPCPTVRALASIWTAHPDYNPSWTVE